MITRRQFMTHLAGISATLLVTRRLLARTGPGPTTPITVYKSASCGCCAKWVDHLRENGFAPTVHDEENMDAVKDEMGVPAGVRSCHTAMLDRYLVEGHVPSADLRRLLAEHPAVAGLAVPGMPASTPGMAMPGQPHEPYEVVAFALDGKTKVFARH